MRLVLVFLFCTVLFVSCSPSDSRVSGAQGVGDRYSASYTGESGLHFRSYVNYTARFAAGSPVDVALTSRMEVPVLLWLDCTWQYASNSTDALECRVPKENLTAVEQEIYNGRTAPLRDAYWLLVLKNSRENLTTAIGVAAAEDGCRQLDWNGVSRVDTSTVCFEDGRVRSLARTEGEAGVGGATYVVNFTFPE